MKYKYNIKNLDCANCAKKIEEKLNKKGIKTIRREKVDLPQEIIDRNRSRAKNRRFETGFLQTT